MAVHHDEVAVQGIRELLVLAIEHDAVQAAAQVAHGRLRVGIQRFFPLLVLFCIPLPEELAALLVGKQDVVGMVAVLDEQQRMPREEVDIHDGIIIGLPAAQFDRDALLEAVVYRLVVGARPSEIVALDFLAADLAQELELLLRLDALRERPVADALVHRDDRDDDVARPLRVALEERHVIFIIQQFTAFKPLAHRPKPMLAKP